MGKAYHFCACSLMSVVPAMAVVVGIEAALKARRVCFIGDSGGMASFFVSDRCDSVYVHPDVVRPEEDGHYAFPEGELQESDGEKPSR